MEMKLEIMPTYKVAYIRHTGPYGAGNSHTMEALKNWSKEAGLLDDGTIILGIAQDDPAATKPENCRYDACLVVSDDFSIQDAHVRMGAISGGKYAVFVIDHTPESVRDAWNKIFPEILRQGYRIDHTKPVIERYAAVNLKNHKCEICVPVSES